MCPKCGPLQADSAIAQRGSLDYTYMSQSKAPVFTYYHDLDSTYATSITQFVYAILTKCCYYVCTVACSTVLSDLAATLVLRTSPGPPTQKERERVWGNCTYPVHICQGISGH